MGVLDPSVPSQKVGAHRSLSVPQLGTGFGGSDASGEQAPPGHVQCPSMRERRKFVPEVRSDCPLHLRSCDEGRGNWPGHFSFQAFIFPILPVYKILVPQVTETPIFLSLSNLHFICFLPYLLSGQLWV